jgi:hypothetical protein
MGEAQFSSYFHYFWGIIPILNFGHIYHFQRLLFNIQMPPKKINNDPAARKAQKDLAKLLQVSLMIFSIFLEYYFYK